jgi:hypothetical protein
VAALDNTVITFDCDSGFTYILAPAWYASGMVLTGGKGSLKVKFQGSSVQEIPPG